MSGDWKIVSAGLLDRLNISNARVDTDISTIRLSRMELQNGGVLKGNLEELVFTDAVHIQENSSLDVSVHFRFRGTNGSFTDEGNNDIPRLSNEGAILRLPQTGLLSRLDLNAGETRFLQEVTDIGTLSLQQGVVLNLMDNHRIRVIHDILREDVGENPVLIKAGNKGTVIHEPYKKYCFENINIQNVDLSGLAIINLGPNSVINNGINWLNTDCESVLFTHFESFFNCEGALVEFINNTEGPATSFKWTFGTLGTSIEGNPTFVFPRTGIYKVTLEASGSGKTMVYEKNITIGENVLDKPSIVINGSLLTSLVPAARYQWYRNGIKIGGAVERSYKGEDDGTYQVAVLNESCNRLSEPVVISGLEDETPTARLGIFIGPNPTLDALTVTMNNDFTGEVEFQFYGPNGALLKSIKTQKNQREFVRDIQMDFLPGLYLLLIKTEELVLTHKIIKE